MNALWGLLKMLLKVEEKMSGQKVCKGESMKSLNVNHSQNYGAKSAVFEPAKAGESH